MRNLYCILFAATLVLFGAGSGCRCQNAQQVGISSLPNSLTPLYFAALATSFPVSTSAREIRVIDGYASATDGGGGIFVWDGTITAANDSCTIVHPTGYSTGAWHRAASIGNTTVEVSWCGAAGGTALYQSVPPACLSGCTGDWYQDSGLTVTATDARPQFALALALAATSGGTVHIPAGNWELRTTSGAHGEFLVPVSNVSWKGDGASASIIRIAPGLNPGGTGYSAVIGTDPYVSNPPSVSNVEITGIGVDCNSDYNQFVSAGFGGATYNTNTAFSFPAGNHINIHHNAITNANGAYDILVGTYGAPYAASNSWVTDNLLYHLGDDPNIGDNSRIAVGGFRVHADRNTVDTGVMKKLSPPQIFASVLYSYSESWPITVPSGAQFFVSVNDGTAPIQLETGSPLANLATGSTSLASFVTQANAAATVLGQGTPFAVMALSGTFHVINGSPTVTASLSTLGLNTYPTGIMLSNGDKIQFASQSGTTYTVSTVSGATITLSGNYTGTTNTATTGTNQSRFQITGPTLGGTVEVLNASGASFLTMLGLAPPYNVGAAVGGVPAVSCMEVHGSESTANSNILRKCTTAINWGADSYSAHGFTVDHNVIQYSGNAINAFIVGGFFATNCEFNDNIATLIGGNGFHTVPGSNVGNIAGGGAIDVSISRNKFVQLVSSHTNVPAIDWEENAQHLTINHNELVGFDVTSSPSAAIFITSEDGTSSQFETENEVSDNTVWRPGTYGFLLQAGTTAMRVLRNVFIDDRGAGNTLSIAVNIVVPTTATSQYDANEAPYGQTLYSFGGTSYQYYPTRDFQGVTVHGTSTLDGNVTAGAAVTATGAVTSGGDFKFSAGLTVSATYQQNTSPISISHGIYAVGVNDTGATAINLNDGPFLGRTFEITDTGENAGTNHITINAFGSEKFYPSDVDGGASYVINTNGASCKFTSLDGTNYYVTGGFNCP